MKIHQLLGEPSIAVTNEEQSFINKYDGTVSLSSLNEHESWVAQNLVRKNVYKLTKDSKNIVINKGHDSNRTSI